MARATSSEQRLRPRDRLHVHPHVAVFLAQLQAEGGEGVVDVAPQGHVGDLARADVVAGGQVLGVVSQIGDKKEPATSSCISPLTACSGWPMPSR